MKRMNGNEDARVPCSFCLHSLFSSDVILLVQQRLLAYGVKEVQASRENVHVLVFSRLSIRKGRAIVCNKKNMTIISG